MTMSVTDRRMLRVSDMLEIIGQKPAGNFGYGCTDRRPLLAAMMRNHAELTALGFKPSTGEVLRPEFRRSGLVVGAGLGLRPTARLHGHAGRAGRAGRR